ncbi:DUF2953 domain-containing protein [Bacillus sp. V3B]|nr:DUF2953 domain-containing protein [Bacillus sp. V3B]
MTKVKVGINYFHAQDNDSLKIEFRALFGLIKYKLDVPLVKVDDNSPTIVVEEEIQKGEKETTQKGTKQFSAEDFLNSFKDMKTLLEHVVSFHQIVRHFCHKVNITQVEWQTVMGTGDAALTGMLTGAVWTIKGSIIGIISHYFRMKNSPHLSVQPHFQLAVTQTSFKCMLQFRIGHAMVAGIKLVKFWKGGWPQFTSKPLSTLFQNKSKPVS